MTHILASAILDKDKTLTAGSSDVTFTSPICSAAGATGFPQIGSAHLFGIYLYISMRAIVVIKKFEITIATNYRTLAPSMDGSYVVGYERASSTLFQCILSVM
jgi:hypothetical protein